jgi:hypothetical protein
VQNTARKQRETACEPTNPMFLVASPKSLVADRLIEFDPRRPPADAFHEIGDIGCAGLGATSSISIDRNGVAWVIANGGVVAFSVSDASCKRPWQVPDDDHAWSSGVFVRDPTAPSGERFYAVAKDASRAIGWLDTTHASVKPHVSGRVRVLSDNPLLGEAKLAATPDGKLFGLWVDYPSPFIQEIELPTGKATGRRWTAGDPSAERMDSVVFTLWNGVFYVFVVTIDSTGYRSSLRTVDRKTGAYQIAMDDLPYVVTAAGTSACAPMGDGR